MAEQSSSMAVASASMVMRDVEMRPQALQLGGRPRPAAPTAERSAAQVLPLRPDVIASKSPNENIQAALAQALAQGHREGLKTGHAEGLKSGLAEGREQARQEILRQAEFIVAAAVDEAVRAAEKRVTERLEQDAQRQGQDRLKRLDTLIGQLPPQIAQRLEDTQDDVLALCLATVTKILGDVGLQASTLQTAFNHAMAQMKAQPLVRVELNPLDLQILQTLPGWDAWTEHAAPGVAWIGSPALAAGGFVLTSPEGSLDARLETQLRAFCSAMVAIRHEAQSTGGQKTRELVS